MCWFCEKIYNTRIEVRNAIAEDESLSEGIYKDDNNLHVYVGDSFGEQYGVLTYIKYCPYCGKQLSIN